MTANELRNKYLEFFKSKGHAIIPSASLMPENDPTVLFTTAGMHPLVPYLMGEKHPGGKLVANVQKCIRTSDIDEVGDATHHTFFEMLGNWSFGDPSTTLGAGYFKKEAIEWSWEFLTSSEWLNFDKNRLAVSVFAGDSDAPFDEYSFNIWKNLGVPETRIAKLPKKNNWWGPAGETGPCGPDAEMFYWVGPADKVPAGFNDDNDLWVEIWNDVFMQYNKKTDGTFKPLAQKNVDTGMGMERMLSALNGLDDNYRTELFWPLIEKIEELSGKNYNSPQPPLNLKGGEILNPPNPPLHKGGEETRAMRIIADHIKAATFILGDEKGLVPSNVGAGYVLRRLIRRAVRYGKRLGINEIFTFKIAEEVVKIYQDTYAELRKNKEFIINQLVKEEEKFQQVIQDGLKKADRIISQKKSVEVEIFNRIMSLSVKDKNESFRKFYRNKESKNDLLALYNISVSNEEIFKATITGKEAFDLYQAYGFPIEMIIELAQEKNLFVDIEDFKDEMKKHQELSRTASAGMFKGGLADASEATVKYHTAAHLMLAALRQVLGEHVAQKGSNITAERLRFDFSHSQKMTPEQIKQVEDSVNEQIAADWPVVYEEMNLEEAKERGAMGVFESKYGEKVKVYTVGNPSTRSARSGPPFSREICGGPHVERTGVLGKFRIQKEESSSAGVRRIKVILE